jgi:hypothetical protein
MCITTRVVFSVCSGLGVLLIFLAYELANYTADPNMHGKSSHDNSLGRDRAFIAYTRMW